MKKYFMNKPVFIILLSLLAFLIALGMIYDSGYQDAIITYDVSVLCAEGDADHFQNFRQGALQAAQDLNVNVRFSYTNEQHGVNNQVKLIQQELANDTQALIVLPYSSDSSLRQICTQAKKTIIYAYSHVIEGEQNYVGSIGEKMGEDFASAILKRQKERKHIALVVKNDMSYTEQSIVETMQESLCSIHFVEVLSFHPEEDDNHLHHLLEKNDFDIVICLDDSLCNQLMQHQSIHDVEIYTMGSKPSLVNALEKENIHLLLVQDDYSIGYLSVKSAVETIQKEKIQANHQVRYAIVDKAHMYESSIERLLFPIVR